MVASSNPTKAAAPRRTSQRAQRAMRPSERSELSHQMAQLKLSW
jgi:hypothetical protein